MERILLCEETVNLAFNILSKGEMVDHDGKSVPPLKECFIESETPTAKHILWEQFVEKTGCRIPKLFGYIVMDKIFGQCNVKDSNGNFGYSLKINL